MSHFKKDALYFLKIAEYNPSLYIALRTFFKLTDAETLSPQLKPDATINDLCQALPIFKQHRCRIVEKRFESGHTTLIIDIQPQDQTIHYGQVLITYQEDSQGTMLSHIATSNRILYNWLLGNPVTITDATLRLMDIENRLFPTLQTTAIAETDQVCYEYALACLVSEEPDISTAILENALATNTDQTWVTLVNININHPDSVLKQWADQLLLLFPESPALRTHLQDALKDPIAQLSANRQQVTQAKNTSLEGDEDDGSVGWLEVRFAQILAQQFLEKVKFAHRFLTVAYESWQQHFLLHQTFIERTICSNAASSAGTPKRRLSTSSVSQTPPRTPLSRTPSSSSRLVTRYQFLAQSPEPPSTPVKQPSLTPLTLDLNQILEHQTAAFKQLSIQEKVQVIELYARATTLYSSVALMKLAVMIWQTPQPFITYLSALCTLWYRIDQLAPTPAKCTSASLGFLDILIGAISLIQGSVKDNSLQQDYFILMLHNLTELNRLSQSQTIPAEWQDQMIIQSLTISPELSTSIASIYALLNTLRLQYTKTTFGDNKTSAPLLADDHILVTKLQELFKCLVNDTPQDALRAFQTALIQEISEECRYLAVLNYITVLQDIYVLNKISEVSEFYQAVFKVDTFKPGLDKTIQAAVTIARKYLTPTLLSEIDTNTPYYTALEKVNLAFNALQKSPANPALATYLGFTKVIYQALVQSIASDTAEKIQPLIMSFLQDFYHSLNKNFPDTPINATMPVITQMAAVLASLAPNALAQQAGDRNCLSLALADTDEATLSYCLASRVSAKHPLPSAVNKYGQVLIELGTSLAYKILTNDTTIPLPFYAAFYLFCLQLYGKSQAETSAPELRQAVLIDFIQAYRKIKNPDLLAVLKSAEPSLGNLLHFEVYHQAFTEFKTIVQQPFFSTPPEMTIEALQSSDLVVYCVQHVRKMPLTGSTEIQFTARERLLALTLKALITPEHWEKVVNETWNKTLGDQLQKVIRARLWVARSLDSDPFKPNREPQLQKHPDLEAMVTALTPYTALTDYLKTIQPVIDQLYTHPVIIEDAKVKQAQTILQSTLLSIATLSPEAQELAKTKADQCDAILRRSVADFLGVLYPIKIDASDKIALIHNWLQILFKENSPERKLWNELYEYFQGNPQDQLEKLAFWVQILLSGKLDNPLESLANLLLNKTDLNTVLTTATETRRTLDRLYCQTTLKSLEADDVPRLYDIVGVRVNLTDPDKWPQKFNQYTQDLAGLSEEQLQEEQTAIGKDAFTKLLSPLLKHCSLQDTFNTLLQCFQNPKSPSQALALVRTLISHLNKTSKPPDWQTHFRQSHLDICFTERRSLNSFNTMTELATWLQNLTLAEKYRSRLTSLITACQSYGTTPTAGKLTKDQSSLLRQCKTQLLGNEYSNVGDGVIQQIALQIDQIRRRPEPHRLAMIIHSYRWCLFPKLSEWERQATEHPTILNCLNHLVSLCHFPPIYLHPKVLPIVMRYFISQCMKLDNSEDISKQVQDVQLYRHEHTPLIKAALACYSTYQQTPKKQDFTETDTVTLVMDGTTHIITQEETDSEYYQRHLGNANAQQILCALQSNVDISESIETELLKILGPASTQTSSAPPTPTRPAISKDASNTSLFSIDTPITDSASSQDTPPGSLSSLALVIATLPAAASANAEQIQQEPST